MIYLLTIVTFLLACPREVSTYIRLENLKRVMANKQVSIVWGVQNVTKDLCTKPCLVDSSSFDEARGSCLAFSPGIGRMMVQKTRPKTGYPVYISKGQKECDCVAGSGGMDQTCVRPSDCYANGTVCYQGRCVCDPEFIFDKPTHACVRKPGGIRQPCDNDNDCFINGSLCFKGRCMCTPGLSYHKAEQACVRKCTVYGKTMSMYEGLGITGHNEEEKRVQSKETCMLLCTTRTDFLCLSVDFYIVRLKCLMSTDGYLDVDQDDRETGQNNWLLGTRDCE